MDRTKLDYILNPENRLYEVELGNGENLDDGFLCHLRPSCINLDDTIWRKSMKEHDDSVSVTIERQTGLVGEGYGIFGYNCAVGMVPPDIHVKVHFAKGDLTEDEMSEVSRYMTSTDPLPYTRKMV